MLSVRQMLLAGAATLLLGLIILFPARIAYHFLAPPDVRLASIDGSIWRGSASEAQIAGVYLRDLRWSLRPLGLLQGRFAFTLTADPAGGFAEADVALGWLGTGYVDALNCAIPLAALQGALRIDGVGGDLTLQLTDVKIEDGWPSHVAGRAGLANLVVRALDPAPLGDFEAEIQTSDDTIIGSIADIRGMLKVAGTLTLTNDRSYVLLGRVGTTASATAGVNQQLSYLGSADSRGLREFRLEGVL